MIPGAGSRPGLPQRAWSLAKRAVIMELRITESLWRVIARRPKLSPGDRGFRYHRPVLTVLIVLMVVSAVEIPILDFIVHRWLPVRIFFLVLGIWGVTWMIGLLCGYLTRPHTVGPRGIRVREGLELDIAIPWENFAEIRLFETKSDPNDPDNKPKRLFDEDGARVCAIRIASETNLELRLEGPTRVRLPGLPPKGGDQEIEVLRFWSDDPKGMLRAVAEELEGRGVPGA